MLEKYLKSLQEGMLDKIKCNGAKKKESELKARFITTALKLQACNKIEKESLKKRCKAKYIREAKRAGSIMDKNKLAIKKYC